jgi:hypothetical protein
MSFISSITRDHAILTILISSFISFISGLIILRLNTRKDQELHDFYLKQEFYINFIARQIIYGNSTASNLDEDFLQKMQLLNAEMLIKADAELIKEIIKLKKLSRTIKDKDKIDPHIAELVNKFRKKVHNNPITTEDFKEFLELVYHNKNI